MDISCRTEPKSDWAVVTVSGFITTIEECLRFRDYLNNLIDKNYLRVGVDICDTLFTCSGFCGFLISALQKAQVNKIELSIIVPHDHPLYEMLKTVSMDKVINFFVSIEEWKKSFEHE